MLDSDLQLLERDSPNLAALMKKDKAMNEGMTLRVFFQEVEKIQSGTLVPTGPKRERLFYESDQTETDAFSVTFETGVQITRIQFPHHLVHDSQVSSVKVGGSEQLLTSGPIPMAVFSELAVANVAFDPLKARRSSSSISAARTFDFLHRLFLPWGEPFGNQ